MADLDYNRAGDGDSIVEETRFGVQESRPSVTMAFGQGLVLIGPDASFSFQNYNVEGNTTLEGRIFTFLPFTYTGISLNRSGDNVSTEIAVPNTEISRPWATTAINSGWLGRVLNLEVDVGNPSNANIMHTYIGQVTSGGWDQQAVILRLNSVLDAVESEVPWQYLSKTNVGPLPISSNVRL